MDDITSGLDPDELMDLEEPENYDLDDDDDELIDEPVQSPFQFLSSGPASAATSAASSPHNNEEFPPPFNFSGKPLSIKRGRGRPRREGGKPPPRRSGSNGAPRVRRSRPFGMARGGRGSRSVRQPDRMEFDFSYISPSAVDDSSILDPETGALLFMEKEKSFPVVEDIPYPPEQWPGKVCAFCNLGERSQLGQGEMLRLNCPEDFIPQTAASEPGHQRTLHTPDKENDDKSPRGPVTCRRQKSFNKCRNPSMTNEYVDELSIIGYIDQPNVNLLFEPTGQFYVHRTCALWSFGVRSENYALENVGPVLLQSSSRKCSFCNHYGASLVCKADGCSKIYHFPCATASGAFQEKPTLTTFCVSHLGHAADVLCESSVCYTCKVIGDIANLIFCSSCGTHYHGTCVGLAQLPGVRAGWQCRKCRICQVCRITGDESKLMSCEQCDKVYHASCQRPIVTSIPKYGWKCRCCRVCGDCGSRTPGAGTSSRWHAHYTVCDSCYQQRNKGYCCPLCRRAYRAHAHREMVQCTACRKYVHGTCDPEADPQTYHQKKELNPDYEYACTICKNVAQQQQQQAAQIPGRQLFYKRSSIDDPSDLSASQESLYDDISEFESFTSDDSMRNISFGKGKPYSASKIAKKRLGFPTGKPGRPKGTTGKSLPGKQGFMKRQRLTEFGRKRGPKAKMRGIFGVPGVGLQRPVSDGKNDEEFGVENRLILCSAKDKFVLTQDICVMCGALGTDQEGCLIGCVHCGQCYHPYCVNVKVTKVILQKGWRCLDCTVCEGCGQRNDEARLILCDDCDVSYHIYCMDPPLDYVPHGNWKCKWCAICETCGATDAGFNCTWMNSCTQCGPCASHVNCPSCNEPYSEGDLIIQCVQCDRWLHGACDFIKNEQDAEKCAEDGYNCILCRPRDVPPPHLVPPPIAPKPPTPTKSPEVKSNANFYIDGVCLSESGHNVIKSLSLEHHGTRKKRRKIPTVQDKEAGIMATIESVVAGGSCENTMDEPKIEMVDIKEEPQELYKEGMIWTKDDGAPPDGFTIFTMENGICVLRRKRQRNLQKLGIGGFLVRMRGNRPGHDTDDIDMLPGQSGQISATGSDLPAPLPLGGGDGDKPRRKPIRRKPKCKLAETFPAYLQEAFFGKDLMDINDLKKEMESYSSDEDKVDNKYQSIRLSAEEILAVAVETAKQEKIAAEAAQKETKDDTDKSANKSDVVPKEEDEDNTEDLKDVLALPGDLLDTDLVNSIINDEDDELTKNTESLEALGDESELGDTLGSSGNSKDAKDELSDILGSHFNLESMPNINSKDVEDIFKGVLTDESQESQESNMFPMQTNSIFSNTAPPPSVLAPLQQHPVPPAPVRPTTLPTVNHSNLNSPVSFPPPSPYHSEYSNSPQFSPAFSEPPSPWVSINEPQEIDSTSVGVPSTYNQRSSEKMKADESLGNAATISAVLYANMNHPEWKTEFPTWSDRYKQLIKKWRTLSQDQKAPYLQQARDNRSQQRMKKAQQSQTSKDNTSTATPPTLPVKQPTVTSLVTSLPSSSGGPSTASPPTPVQSEVCTQPRPAATLTTASTSSVSVSPSPPKRPISPSIHQQFTVHGHFAGPSDHVGPAPNVTVNPHYQPNSDQIPPPPMPRSLLTQQSNASATDQQIRVLTPSEIMRTLPSLCQENYEPQQMDQEKVSLQQKSVREAEQERQWKQLQALRQQQAQQQQHVIHEQRVQAIARVQKTVSDPTQPFIQGQISPLQINTPQELSPAASPSPRQFIGIKSPTFPHSPSVGKQSNIPPASNQSPAHDFQQPPTPDSNDPFTQSPTTSKPTSFQPRVPVGDPFAQQPGTPRPQFAPPRPNLQGFPNQTQQTEQPAINRQLRDLLQRQQQFKNLDLVPGKASQRVWPPNENAEAEPGQSSTVTSSDVTFRQPLPPSIARPRMQAPLGPRMGMRLQQIDPARMQGLDPRMRLILQQQQRMVQTSGQVVQQQQQPQQQTVQQDQFVSGTTVRFAPRGIRPTTVEQYEQLLSARQSQLQNRLADQQVGPRIGLNPGTVIHRQIITQGPGTVVTNAPSNANVSETANNEQEIPDNVTAELEKLEQETGTMVELHGVSDILGGLGDDDDELLAEMGADFNILEYADPELEALAGEKTNILDLALEDDNIKDKRKENNANAPQQIKPEATSTNGAMQPAVSTTNNVEKSEIESPQTVQAENTAPPPVPQQVVTSSLPVAASIVTSQTPGTQNQTQQIVHNPIVQLLHPQHLTPQQIHQQMIHQVQQAAAQGKPIIPGTKLQTPDGIVGLVLPNNNVHLQLPPNYQQRLFLQLQNQRIQMRVGQAIPRMMSGNTAQPPSAPAAPGPRMGVAPPPPPPPYPGPPPPYPGNVTPQHQSQQQQPGLRMGSVLHLPPSGHMHPMTLQGIPMYPHLQRRPLLLEEQPLLLEDLLEQEKREQEKQHQPNSNQEISSTKGLESDSALLSEHDFERLKADVFNTGPVNINTSPNQGGLIQQQSWQQQSPNRPVPTPTPQPVADITSRIQMFSANLLPAPPLPPENIISEQDKQTQMVYEQWLNHQNNVLSQQLRHYETEVQKLRKSRKSLNSKQRQLKKSGNQLTEADAAELHRISTEQAFLQKHLESSRKQSRQHGMLIQEYRNKQQAKQAAPGHSPLQQMNSPLGPPASSPIHHPNSAQSPMMSPSASPLMQHSSPMHSPGPVVSHSPGPGSVVNILQSPGSMAGNSMSPMQPSPRIGTPHSQGEGSPGPVQSPSQVCLPPPAPRMTSPQHRRVVTSPVGYTGELRAGAPQMRFVRTPIDHAALQQRIRVASPMQNFQQKSGTPSPLNSPPPGQINITQQQLLQKQLQQQALLHQQQQQHSMDGGQQDPNILHSQRAAQLIQHRNLIRQVTQQQVQQQQQQQQQQGQQQPPQAVGQPQPLTPQQHQLMVQQQQQLAKLQLSQYQSKLNQQQINQQVGQPHSPMPPKSPLVSQQIMSPHSLPASPMPPKSPLISFSSNQQQTPNSPVSRSPFHQGVSPIHPPSSPMTHQYQPQSSPMMSNQIHSPHGVHRPPSANSSPAMPDRPTSVENPSTPRTSYSIDNQIQDNMLSGGGNPNNPNNPIPIPPDFMYSKLGLRGGTPMWPGFGRGEKRVPTPPTTSSLASQNDPDKVPISEPSSLVAKPRKESHLSKVSILKKKPSLNKTNLKSLAVSRVASLVSTDYNDFDDSSCTPPVTPPPLASTSRHIQKALQKQDDIEVKQLHLSEMMDYDDENNALLSTEVSLNSAAQQNDDELEITETLSQSDIGEVLSSPLEADQISDEFLLFQENMVVDISGGVQYSDKDEEVEEDYSGENVHIVIRSPTTSDDEFIIQDKTKKYNILPSGSPEQEEVNANTSPEAVDENSQNYEESQIVIMQPTPKSPEEQISTKEDFEELIDEGSRKDKLKHEIVTAKHINEFHKYAATNVYSFPPKSQTMKSQNVVTVPQKLPQKISLITTSPVIHNFTAVRSDSSKVGGEQQLILAPNSKITTAGASQKLTSIILTHKSAVRSNMINVSPKIVTTVPAITIVSASTSQIATLPSKFTVPVISASQVRQLPNVKVIDKPSSSLSLTTHDSSLPKKIFEDDSVSPDSSNCEDDKSKDSSDEKSKTDSPASDDLKSPTFPKAIEPLKKTDKFSKRETLKETSSQIRQPIKVEYAVRENTPNAKVEKVHNIQITNLVTKEQTIRTPSPIISKTSPPVIIHNTPELKMTAQVIQETTQPHMQITATTETVNSFDGSSEDTKSVVISIPSPTPSQEQMLDNIALQALESHRRREFESFEDVLDMIENITAEPPELLEESPTTSATVMQTSSNRSINQVKQAPETLKEKAASPKESVESLMSSSSTNKSSVPQLSPLSQPTELTTNMANASQQLRSLLSSLQTTSSSLPTNVEPVIAKSVGNKPLSSATSVTTPPIVATRVIQQAGRQSPIITSVSTVIVPNLTKVTSPSPNKNSPMRTQQQIIKNVTSTIVTTSPSLGFLSSRTVGGIHLMPDHPKLPPVTNVVGSQQTSNASVITAQTSISQKVTAASTQQSTIETNVVKKPSLTLTAMLQNQPAATPTTKPSVDTITAASLLATPIGLSRTSFTSNLIQAQPNQNISSAGNNTTTSAQSVITSPSYRPPTSTTNLLHTQLTKVARTKSLDDIKDLKVEDNKIEIKAGSPDILTTKPELFGCKYSTISTPPGNRADDSQNVLLKKLLQNTACASTQSPPPNTVANTTSTAPTIPSAVETKKPSTPTLASLLPPVIKTEPQIVVSQTQAQLKPVATVPRMPIRETSFVSSPVIQQLQQPHSQTPLVVNSSVSSTMPTQQLHIDVKKCLPPNRTPSRDDLLSPPTPRSSCSQDSSLQTPPLIIKKEPPTAAQISNIFLNHEVKKELMDETSQHSEVSDHSRPDIPLKEEIESMDSTSDTKVAVDKEELKKQKRRMYQQKRRQNQQIKEVGQPKKRQRKNSKIEEDYDSYIDSVLSQLRNLPPLSVSEPVLNRNYGVVPAYGSGDMSKLGTKNYDSRTGDLDGTFGNSIVPGYSDFYNTNPYGDEEPLPEKPPVSTQRGFYDQEFPLIRFDNNDDKKFDMFSREDTPDSIVSSSSPECMLTELDNKYMGLKLISDDDDDDIEDKNSKQRLSPEIPMIKPIPIRLKPAGLYIKDISDPDDKENICQDLVQTKVKPNSTPEQPLKDSGNVTVTLTLTSSAAEDIIGVLKDLANILQIPAPTSYKIVDRSSTPPNQKLGLYRTKGKDGKEGAPIDIQSILNGAAKFCKHCDVVILSNMIRKKVSDLPVLAKDSELINEGEELYFCSTTCYMQFALMHKSPSISEDRAAAIIDHLSQKDRFDAKQRKSYESFDQKHIFPRMSSDSKEFKREEQDMGDFGSFFHGNGDFRANKFDQSMKTTQKTYKNIRYKLWSPGCLQPSQKHKRPTDKEIMEMLYRMAITVTPPKMPEDTRKCMFCQVIGDGVADGPARLLNFDVDKWVHLNCALWSDGVYETVNGALMNLENAIQQSLQTYCVHCSRIGATIRCFKTRCSSVYHLSCAVKDSCVFFKNKTVYCTAHVPKNEKDNELTTLSVGRRVYVNRDENRQVAAVMHHSDTNNLLRVGSLIFLNVGQLLPHQLQNFHTPNYIYPIGYKIIRFYWSMRFLNKRCRYICSIHDICGRPEFRVLIQEQTEEDIELKDPTLKGVWLKILDKIAAMRKQNQCLQMFPKYVSGEDLFGLTEPAIVRVLESLPGIETLSDYKFKYGRNPLLELPLAINPSGAARTEPKLRNQMHWKRPHTQRTTGSTSRPLFGPAPTVPTPSSVGEAVCPYSKQFVHSKSSQYKKMKQEWRNNIYLARSKIQGLGLYAARDLEKHTMIIEYIGEVIRTELSECREKQYEAKNRGIYMFRLDDDRVVDATLCGGLARYINHSCNPNCVAETVEIDRDLRIIIFAKRRIQRGEELAYDYKFDIEDDQHKISCMCGAPNCRKWMN